MSETFREGEGAGGTAREVAGGGLPGEVVPVGGGTAREVVTGRGVGGSGFVRVGLLPCLSGRFSVVADLGGGGEADVLLVADGDGEQWVVKQYRQQGWSPSVDVLDRLADARAGRSVQSWGQDSVSRGVVWLEQWGTDPSSGLFFEVQEYVAGGSLLEQLRAWPVTDLAGALTQTVAGFHELVGAHRDIKPANVLVREVLGPVLVLVDVGLSRDVGELSHRMSRRDGSAAYQAPEAAQGLVSRAGDWWSVGMMVAEAALGFHPLALPNGAMPADQVMLTELAQRDVPHLDLIEDDRVRLLCQGLLTRDADKRWRAQQVRAWQAGQTPTTGYGTSRLGPASVTRVRLVRFAGHEHTSPASLAAALAELPDMAANAIFLAKDPVLVEDLRLMLQSHGLHEASEILTTYRSGPWQGPFLRLLAEMDPSLPPRLGGQSMTPEDLVDVAADVVHSGSASTDQAGALSWVVEHDLWRLWRALPGMDESASTAERMTLQLIDFCTRNASDALRVDSSGKWHGIPVETARSYFAAQKPMSCAWEVLAAARPQPTSDTIRGIVARGRDDFAGCQWWLDLADENGALGVLTIGLATLTEEVRHGKEVEAADHVRRAQRMEELLAELAPHRERIQKDLARLRKLPNKRWNREMQESLRAELSTLYPWDNPAFAWDSDAGDWIEH